MRVLLVSGAYPPMQCGIGDYTARLARSLGKRKDVTVAVLTDTAAGSAIEDVTLFPLVRTWGLRETSTVLGLMRKWRPDIVHVQYPSHSYRKIQWVLPTLAWLASGPVVQTWHEYYSPRNWPSVLNAALPGGLVVVRPHYMEKMPGWFRWLNRHKEVRYIPNASSIPAVSLTETERNVIHARLGASESVLIAYFGFAYPAKEIEALFEIADPQRDRLVLICDLSAADAYQASILALANRDDWAGKVTVTGFLPPDEAANLLAAADAVVLPFRDGGGEWNSSIHSAAVQGTFVLTNSRESQGYDEDANIYYALPSDVPNMQRALRQYAGRRRRRTPAIQGTNWDSIASAHMELYQSLLEGKG
ncbi:MAG: glycosyltransferase [Deltaproteobacteria bacterium]|nr:glycosyltransferase [Deltaproteobacteria bacterium]